MWDKIIKILDKFNLKYKIHGHNNPMLSMSGNKLSNNVNIVFSNAIAEGFFLDIIPLNPNRNFFTVDNMDELLKGVKLGRRILKKLEKVM